MALAAVVSERRRALRALAELVEERTTALRAAVRRLEEAQDALVRRERLAVMGEVASGISHELRTPLGVMSNAIDYLGMIQPDAPPKVREYLRILANQVHLADRIIGNLLDIARGKPPERNVVDLPELVHDQLKRIEIPGEIDTRVEFEPGLPLVLADPVQIGQVVYNLLLNAVHAMAGPGGILRIEARRADTRVEMAVEDTGPGIAPALQERIFEPLFTTRPRGLGLGLAVSRAFARANDGDLTVSSIEGKGARFTITLPSAEAGPPTIPSGTP
jgi:signal transduction histidine kinase